MDAPNFIILMYAAGSAGKTIATALGLSAGATISDSRLCVTDLTSAEKFKILKNKFNDYYCSNDWTDLNLGNNTLGPSFRQIMNGNNKDISIIENKEIIPTLLGPGKKLLFVFGHRPVALDLLKKEFQKCKTIYMFNGIDVLTSRKLSLLEKRMPGISKWWSTVTNIYESSRHPNWPCSIPTSIDQIDLLPLPDQEKLKQFLILNDKKFNLLRYSTDDLRMLEKVYGVSGIDYFYNGKHLLDSNLFLNSIKDLYSFFNLPDFEQNKEYILEYYNMWADINLKK